MAADGSIVIQADIDDKQAQAELNRLTKKIDSLNDKIASKKQERMPLVEQAQKLGAELDAAKATLDHMKSGEEFFPTATVDAQAEKVKAIQSEWEAATKKVESVDNSINKMTGDLDRTQAKAGEVSAQLMGAGSSSNFMASAVDQADQYMSKFLRRVKGLARRVLVFSVITMALRGLRTWLGNVVKTSPEATAAIAKLKGALLTLAQPLVEIIIPAFTAFVNVLTRVINSISSAFSALFGKSIGQSAEAAENLYNEQQALEGVGSAAKDAGKSMASFDEINQLSNSSSSGGGGSSSDTITPDFDFDTSEADGLLSIIEAIGSALLAWRISSALKLGLQGFLGLLMSVYSAIQFVKNMLDALANGVDWTNFLGMLASAAGIVAGLYIALGKTAAAVGLLVTGILMLITGFHDMIENGMTLENTLLSIAGIMAAGIGISILTGSWIPALIAGIASAGLALVNWAGNGKQLVQGLSMVFQGFSNLITALVNGDIRAAGEAFKLIWEGVKISASAVWESIKTGISTLGAFIYTWLEDLFNRFLTWAAGVSEKRQELFESLKAAVSSLFNGIVTSIQSCWESIKAWWNANVAPKLTLKFWQEKLSNIGNGVVESIKNGINGAIALLNNFIDWCNEHLIIRIPTVTVFGHTFGGGSIKLCDLPNIPYLAQGAVIPPNREFMAVLGDQKSGTNIETPLATMVQAFKQAMQEGGYGGNSTIIMEVDGQQFAKVVYNANKAESRRVGVNLAEV